ncbi:uncharacterized protein DFL_003749 [Arthrobotrys flagrans]|uniref:Uncharacterized protein n=1 Tax=Arthrobotrys flagrans TaxID=97331 RepID=A0A437A2Q2_ARTFL|nr:hypothetical protein DFL_003749 [Arthrobotrys flagrans]
MNAVGRVEALIRALRRNMELTSFLSRRRRAALGFHNPNAQRPVRRSVFKEEFDFVDVGPDIEKDSNDGGDDNEGRMLSVNDVAELPLLNTTKEAATSPTSPPQPQPQHIPIITNEDSNIISGTLNANTAWLRERLSNLLPPESLLPHETTQCQSQSEQDAEMGKKRSAKQARHRQAKIGAGSGEQPSMPSAPVPETPRGPDTTQTAVPAIGPKVKPVIEDPVTDLLKTIAAEMVGSRTIVPETIAPEPTGPSNDTQPTKDKLIVGPQLFQIVTDIGIFTKWKREDFLNLNRNDLLVFVHLYCRDKMPTADDVFCQVRRVFFDDVYEKYYWISWVRDIILTFLRSSAAAEMAGEDAIAALKVAAEDAEFLGTLAPEFKALCQERFA